MSFSIPAPSSGVAVLASFGRSWHSHIPFGLLFNFQGAVRRSFTCSHWEEQNYRVLLKIFCFAKNPFTHLDKGCRNAHPFLRFSKKIFYSVKRPPHLFGITKPNDTLFHRKNEKIFFIRLLDGLFLLVKKVPSLIWN